MTLRHKLSISLSGITAIYHAIHLRMEAAPRGKKCERKCHHRVSEDHRAPVWDLQEIKQDKNEHKKTKRVLVYKQGQQNSA